MLVSLPPCGQKVLKIFNVLEVKVLKQKMIKTSFWLPVLYVASGEAVAHERESQVSHYVSIQRNC